MCYREEQALDFSGIHLACLAGDNGHGKSALLDAMTWALWGKARARRDDELITLGNDIDEMWVEFEFYLGNQLYRVWRQRSKRGRGQSDLHFYVWNQAADDWQLLDEGGLLERQRQITRTLRMEYETFANSAFVLQGRADSFTVKTPSERKEILADILGLGLYDLYEARAREEAQAVRESVGRLQGEIAAIDDELSRRSLFEARLTEAQRVAEDAEKTLEAAEARKARQQDVLRLLKAKQDQLTALQGRLGRARRDLEDLRGTLQAAERRLGGYQEILRRREEIEQGWRALESARMQDQAFNERLLLHTKLEEEVNEARREIDREQAELGAEQRRLEAQRRDLERKATLGVQQAAILQDARAALAQMATWQQRRDEIAAAREEIVAAVSAVESEQNRVRAEGQAATKRIEMLETAETASCPLCEQPLTPEHRDRMLDDLRAEHAALVERYQAAGVALKRLTEERKALQREDADLETRLRARDARQQQVARAESVAMEGEQAVEEIAQMDDAIAVLAARLKTEEFGEEARGRLAALQARQVEVGYDPAAHRQARETMTELGSFAALYQRDLLPALESVGAAQEQAEKLAAQVARREEELAEDVEAERRLSGETEELPEAEAALAEATAALEAAAAVERRARLEEGAAIQQLEALDRLAERRVQIEAGLETANAEIALLIELRAAFGKKGIQAMIIESVIPEVETEANLLLSRMTEGRMSLRLETQREKVTGGVAETLDIIISDELGSRSYEMYSGGEAFRANLALRIAISKLLAHRAGTQLQTLVVDEGFGTQDSQGRSLLVEAINSIQDDFERIIVITHIEELKDLFPARIDVVKTPTGSQISVN